MEEYKIYLVCFAIGLIVWFSGGFGLGKKEISFERGISLVMFSVWLIAITAYGAFEREIPSLLNIAWFGSIITLMGVDAWTTIKTYLETRIWKL